jgi:mannose-1-phosphate guanylyltransferase
LGTAEEQAVLERVWAEVENETIDYGIMERAEDVAVIPVDIGWSDVGSWATLFELLPADREGNVVVGQHVGLNTTGCVIHGSRRLVTTIDLEGTIIIDTEDALLVCPRERAQEVKKLVDMLKEMGKDEYL